MLHLWGAGRRLLRIWHALAVDREVRAVHPAQVTAAALLRLDDMRRMIALGIESGGERQNFGRTEFNTEPASFTALHDNGNSSLSHPEPPKGVATPDSRKLWQRASHHGVMRVTDAGELAH